MVKESLVLDKETIEDYFKHRDLAEASYVASIKEDQEFLDFFDAC